MLDICPKDSRSWILYLRSYFGECGDDSVSRSLSADVLLKWPQTHLVEDKWFR